jgi:hypothetical protein
MRDKHVLLRYVLYIHVPLCARLCLVSLGLIKHALRMFYKLLQKTIDLVSSIGEAIFKKYVV